MGRQGKVRKNRCTAAHVVKKIVFSYRYFLPAHADMNESDCSGRYIENTCIVEGVKQFKRCDDFGFQRTLAVPHVRASQGFRLQLDNVTDAEPCNIERLHLRTCSLL